ncbi:trophoblast glycoprotein [Notechis scutatus]|uniref:Trophoblast glycoprotein n=1 Tax=Notechis scutatus TaxID=8663 RepID=A0A6J1TRH6_9SAUR|nr:trophoblast glycoprotein [Notechis scutatus]XP_026520951.1 trophoblast glycoprotein [Notechis scutatus]
MLGSSLWGRASPALSGERRGAGGLELLLLLVLSGWVWAQQSQLQILPCPALCECFETTRTVKCINDNLTEVPSELPPSVEGLFLTHNCIRNLSSASFLSASLYELTVLDLRGNQLSWVGAETFAGLPHLKQLDLSDSSLTWLSPMALGNASSPLEELDLSSSLYNNSFVPLVAELLQTGTLLNLKRLDLSDNNLIYLPARMFSTLPSLEHLDTRNNSLVSLHNVFFGSLQRLHSFNLGSNSFKTLRNDTLQQIQGLPLLSLNLSSNPWVCDCHIEDLVKWLKESKQVEAKGSLKCSYPRELQERSLVSINVSELDCSLLIDDQTPLQTSYVFLGIVLALIGAIFLLVLYLNRKGIKKWMYNIRDACRDHMEGYHYRYEINTDPRLTSQNSNSDV